MTDPFDVLGLPRSAGADDVHVARRNLAKRHHPDVGGDPAEMRRVNEAVTAALAAIAGREARSPTVGATPSGPTAPPRPTVTPDGRRIVHDHASFTVEALPTEAFEALLVVAAILGDVLVDDPPHLLEAHLRDPVDCWSRVELLPDGGAASVALTVASVETGPAPDIDVVRDAWVDELNRLDWDRLA